MTSRSKKVFDYQKVGHYARANPDAAPADIAKALGLSSGAVYYGLKRANLVRRAPVARERIATLLSMGMCDINALAHDARAHPDTVAQVAHDLGVALNGRPMPPQILRVPPHLVRQLGKVAWRFGYKSWEDMALAALTQTVENAHQNGAVRK